MFYEGILPKFGEPPLLYERKERYLKASVKKDCSRMDMPRSNRMIQAMGDLVSQRIMHNARINSYGLSRAFF